MNLYNDAPDEDDGEVGQVRCTPEVLKEFVLRSLKATGKVPTLAECKAEFGGIIGAIVAAWELRRVGEWQKLMNMRKRK